MKILPLLALLAFATDRQVSAGGQDGWVEEQDGRVERQDGRVESQDGRVERQDERVQVQDEDFEEQDGQVEGQDEGFEEQDGALHMQHDQHQVIHHHQEAGCMAIGGILCAFAGQGIDQAPSLLYSVGQLALLALLTLSYMAHEERRPMAGRAMACFCGLLLLAAQIGSQELTLYSLNQIFIFSAFLYLEEQRNVNLEPALDLAFLLQFILGVDQFSIELLWVVFYAALYYYLLR